jgi:hypothetical protein
VSTEQICVTANPVTSCARNSIPFVMAANACAFPGICSRNCWSITCIVVGQRPSGEEVRTHDLRDDQTLSDLQAATDEENTH